MASTTTFRRPTKLLLSSTTHRRRPAFYSTAASKLLSKSIIRRSTTTTTSSTLKTMAVLTSTSASFSSSSSSSTNFVAFSSAVNCENFSISTMTTGNCSNSLMVPSAASFVTSGDQQGAAFSSPTGDWHVWVIPLLVFFAIVTTFGNFLVVVSVLVEKTLRTSTNYCLVSLAMADMLVGCIVMPLATSQEWYHDQWVIGSLSCNIYQACDVMASTCSILNLCLISHNRYMAIAKPLIYNTSHRRKLYVGIGIATTWIVSIVISAPLLLGVNDVPRGSKQESICAINSGTYAIYLSIITFFTPSVAIAVQHIVILRSLAERARHIRLRVYTPKCQSPQTTNKKRRSSVAENDGATSAVNQQPHEQHVALTLLQARKKLVKNALDRNALSSDDDDDDDDAKILDDLPVINSSNKHPAAMRLESSDTTKATSLGNNSSNKLEESSFDTAPPPLGDDSVFSHNEVSRQKSGSRSVGTGKTASIDEEFLYQSPSMTTAIDGNSNRDDSINLEPKSPLAKMFNKLSRPSIRSRCHTGESFRNADVTPSPPMIPKPTSASAHHTESMTIVINVHRPISFCLAPNCAENMLQQRNSNGPTQFPVPPPSRNSSSTYNLNNPPVNYYNSTSSNNAPPTCSHHKSSSLSAFAYGAKRSSSSGQYSDRSGSMSSRLLREDKAIAMLFIITVGFFTCWLPYFVATIINGIDDMVPTIVIDALRWLGHINSTMNPIFYSIFSKEFRTAIWRRLTLQPLKTMSRVGSVASQIAGLANIYNPNINNNPRRLSLTNNIYNNNNNGSGRSRMDLLKMHQRYHPSSSAIQNMGVL